MHDLNRDLSNAHLMGIIPERDDPSIVTNRSKDMVNKTLKKELESCNVPQLRQVAHAVLGKGTWISIGSKREIIDRVLDHVQKLEEPDQKEVLRIVKEVQAGTWKKKKETIVFTPRMKNLLAMIGAEIGREIVKQIQKADLESLL
jgi:hypothetical protein